jgi:protein-L-isoaspartate(D-aspartate) O-methyltransferase
LYQMKLILLKKQFLFIFSTLLLMSFYGCKDQNKDNAVVKNDTKTDVTSDQTVPAKSSDFNLLDRTDHPPLDSKENYVKWCLTNTGEEEFFINARWERAGVAIKWKDITEQRVLEAFLRTPRQFFCREVNRKRAYDNSALTLAYGVTISGPHMVAKMTDVLNPGPNDKVLEIGTGSGYQSAVFSELSNHVYSIEIIEPLAKETDALYKSLEAKYPEYKNINRKIDDGYYGWPEYAPFDRIAVTCSIDHIPPALIEQLAPTGIMLIPVGPPSGQTLLKVTKKFDAKGNMTIVREDVYKGKHFPVFVPFTSDGGKGKHSISKDKPKI